MSITGWTSLFAGVVYTRFYEVGLQSGEPYICFLLKATFSKYTAASEMSATVARG